MKVNYLVIGAALMGIASDGCAQSEQAQPRSSAPMTESMETKVFAIPTESPISCAAVPADSVPRGARQAYNFRIGPDLGDQRVITAGYDSAGKIVRIREVASTLTSAAGTSSDMLIAVFRNGTANGIHSHNVERPNAAVGDTTFNMRPLSPAQLDQAKALGAWLWSRKCR
jgi:hypothetical protein